MRSSARAKKRRVKLKLDRDVVEALEVAGVESTPAVVHEALRDHVERSAHRLALDAWLDGVDDPDGPPGPETRAHGPKAS